MHTNQLLPEQTSFVNRIAQTASSLLRPFGGGTGLHGCFACSGIREPASTARNPKCACFHENFSYTKLGSLVLGDGARQIRVIVAILNVASARDAIADGICVS
jgi:hypothetical protein